MISIVILNWDGLEFLMKCIPSVIKAVGVYGNNYEVTVVDNGSSDDSISYLKENFPQIRLISLKENFGFAKAMNIGIKESKNDIVISLNNDIIVDENFISPLVGHFSKNGDIFAVAIKMLLWDRKTLCHGKAWASFRLGHLKVKFFDSKIPTYTFYACAGGMALDKKKFIELGGFDEELTYTEDIDLCYRAWKRGWKIIFEPKSLMYHKNQGTIKKVFGPYGVWVDARKNNFFFFWKNIHDRWITLQHIVFLPPLLCFALFTKRLYLIEAFFMAIKKMPLFLNKRRLERKKENLLSDRDILKISRGQIC